MLMEGPGSPPPTCRISVLSPKQPTKVTQAMLNKIMHDDRNVAAIRANIGRDGRKLVGMNKITQDGLNGLRAQVIIPGKRPPARFGNGHHIL